MKRLLFSTRKMLCLITGLYELNCFCSHADCLAFLQASYLTDKYIHVVALKQRVYLVLLFLPAISQVFFHLYFSGKSGSGKEDRQHLLSASSSVTQNGGG